MKEMLLTQKNRLRLRDEERRLVTAMSWHAARLYNVGLYSVRQFFFLNHQSLPYTQNYHQCKDNENYKLLLTDTGQQILRLVERNMKSFFALLGMKQAGHYAEEVNLPRYKKKEAYGLVAIQGRSARIIDGWVHIGFSKAFREKYQPQIHCLKFKLPDHIQVKRLQEVRLLPVANGQEFDIEFVYKKRVTQTPGLDPAKHLSIDLGLDNFASCFASTDGSSFVLDGRYLKSINQRYNKENARLQSIKDLQGIKFTTRRMLNLSRRRGYRLNDYFNRAVKYITDQCLSKGIGTLVVGDFSDIKRDIQLGKRTNQNFVQIPYGLFRQKLQSKCEQEGIAYHAMEESHTSKCSFLDSEPICHQEQYLGRRIKRGLFKTRAGRLVNADVNGAANILAKFLARTDRLAELIRERVVPGFVTNPARVKFKTLLASSSKSSGL
ncbi:MAG: RNA-guided endonuclease InsQ/TnpB family protein [Candidatus Sericytochromatia bacterium]